MMAGITDITPIDAIGGIAILKVHLVLGCHSLSLSPSLLFSGCACKLCDIDQCKTLTS